MRGVLLVMDGDFYRFMAKDSRLFHMEDYREVGKFFFDERGYNTIGITKFSRNQIVFLIELGVLPSLRFDLSINSTWRAGLTDDLAGLTYFTCLATPK